MKKKNGFTLIEIIGAIVILGVIAIIAFSTYTSSLTGFRTNYYTKELKTIAKTAEEFFNDNRNYKPTKILNAQEVSLNTLETKDYIGKVVDYNGNSCSDSSYAMVVKEGLNDYSYHVCLICDKDGYDNTVEDPYCDRSWLDPTKVTYGIGEIEKKYVYKGTSREELREELELPLSYIRRDNNGNIIATRRGTKEGNETIFPVNMDVVNTESLGTYQVTYKYGEEEKRRAVEVYENSAPSIAYKTDKTVATTLSGTTSTSNGNYVDGVWAQNVIVILSTNGYKEDGVETSKFQWNVDGRWQDFCDSDPCEKKITRELNQTVQFRTVDTKGHISLVTNEINIKIDNTKPRCSLSIPTTIGENGWYNQNVEVVFNEKLDQKVTDDTSLVSGIKNYNIQVSTENLARVATIGTKTQSADTANIKYIGYVEDEAGNFNTCEVTFKKDGTAPTCTNSGDSNTWTNANRTIKYGCSDALSTCNTNNSGGETSFTTTTKTANIASYTIKDKAGNQTTCPARTANVYVDKTKPECTNSGDSTSWTNANRTINYGCSDGDSGCNASYSGGSKAFSTTTKTSSIAAYTIKDVAGNQTTCPARTANVYVDKTAPTCTNSGDSTSWTNANRTINYGCSDGDSGCNASYSGGSKAFSTTTKTSTIASYTIKDIAGNSITCPARTASVYVDKTAPTCTSSGDSTTWTNGNRTINYGCSDNDSGCNSSYSGGSQAFSVTTTTANIAAYTIKDEAGNSTTCPARTVNIYVDKTAPTCTNSGDSKTWTNSNRTISYGCSDSESGCNSSYSGGSKAFSTTTKTSTIAAYTIKDTAGNTTTCPARTANVYVDKTAPTCTNSGDSTTWTSGNRTINYGCSDSDSGCNSSYNGGSQAFTTTTKTSTIAAYTIKDAVGNTTTCPARTVSVYVDKTAPTCTNSGDSTAWTTSNRTISYGCSDSESGCNASYSGGSQAFSTTTKTSSIAAYTIKDAVGNATTCPARTANVYVDKTAPTCTNSGDSTTWTNSNRTIYYGCSDGDSGCNSSYSGGSKAFTATTKTSSIAAYTIKDAAGNTVSCPARTANVYVDKTAPSCTNSGDSTTWTSGNRTISYGCSDSESGCNASYSGGSQAFSTTTKTSSIAAYTIKDAVGNTTTCPARTANVYVDKTAPSCTNSGDSTTWTNSNRTIYYGCSDGDSGCNASYSGGSKAFTATTKTSSIAAYTIKDAAGNTVSCPARTANVYVDKTAPSCTNSGDSTSWTNGNRTIYYGCSDGDSGCNASYSGGSKAFTTTTKTSSIAAYTIKDTAGNSTTCAARTANVYVDKTAPTCTNSGDNTSWTNGNRTIYYGCSDGDSGCNSSYSGGSQAFTTTTRTSDIASYTIKDVAGNSTTCAARTANVYVDKTAPTCTNSGDNTSWTTNDVTIYYGCSDGNSGCASGNSGGSTTFTTTTKTSSIAAYTIKDVAGNSTTCAARTANVYVGKPTTCSAGYYLNGLSCAGCEAGYYCVGGTYNPNETVQGRAVCPSGTTSDAYASSCYNLCSQTAKEAICGQWCSDSEIDSDWTYSDPNVTQTLPEGRCTIRNGKCYVFLHFHTACWGRVTSEYTTEGSFGTCGDKSVWRANPHFSRYVRVGPDCSNDYVPHYAEYELKGVGPKCS